MEVETATSSAKIAQIPSMSPNTMVSIQLPSTSFSLPAFKLVKLDYFRVRLSENWNHSDRQQVEVQV